MTRGDGSGLRVGPADATGSLTLPTTLLIRTTPHESRGLPPTAKSAMAGTSIAEQGEGLVVGHMHVMKSPSPQGARPEHSVPVPERGRHPAPEPGSPSDDREGRESRRVCTALSAASPRRRCETRPGSPGMTPDACPSATPSCRRQPRTRLLDPAAFGVLSPVRTIPPPSPLPPSSSTAAPGRTGLRQARWGARRP